MRESYKTHEEVLVPPSESKGVTDIEHVYVKNMDEASFSFLGIWFTQNIFLSLLSFLHFLNIGPPSFSPKFFYFYFRSVSSVSRVSKSWTWFSRSYSKRPTKQGRICWFAHQLELVIFIFIFCLFVCFFFGNIFFVQERRTSRCWRFWTRSTSIDTPMDRSLRTILRCLNISSL